MSNVVEMKTDEMNEFRLGKFRVSYTLIRSSVAKRMRIEMTMDEMRVTVPQHLDDDQIDAALYDKRRWIIENRADLDDKLAQTHKIARFRTGAKIPFWGRLARLTTQTGNQVSVDYRSGFVVRLPDQPSPDAHDDIVEAALRRWMRERLAQEARRFCNRYADRLSTDYAGLRIVPLSSRWGSCGENGIVTLDWHLVFAPKRVLEYVVAHELAHRVERHHGEAFWKAVKVVFGDYEPEHDWLVRNEHLLGYRRIPLTIE